MNAAAKHKSATQTSQDGMSLALVYSLLFHAFVLTVGMVGWPYMDKPADDYIPPIPVEMVTMADITQTNKKAPPAPKPPEKKPPKPEPERPKQAPKQVAKPQLPSAAPEDETIPSPKKEKPKAKEKHEEQHKEKPKHELKKPLLTREDAQSADDPFKSLLKNLQDEKPPPSKDAGKTKEKPEQAIQAPLAQQLTLSEKDYISQQLGRCWMVLAGARYAEGLVVNLKIFMNPDGTVAQASIVDMARYQTDSVFRAAADSAIRAVRDPACSPFKLPPEKYEQWKEIDATFDPSKIL